MLQIAGADDWNTEEKKLAVCCGKVRVVNIEQMKGVEEIKLVKERGAPEALVMRGITGPSVVREEL